MGNSPNKLAIEGALIVKFVVELPIAQGVREILDGVRTPAEAGASLMTRQLRSEVDYDQTIDGTGSTS